VTVFARDPFVADALSTALFVLGPGQGASLLNHHPGTGALFAEWRSDSLEFIPMGCWNELELR
jgi:thiamine biosynthesis lipoprotein ApbE